MIIVNVNVFLLCSWGKTWKNCVIDVNCVEFKPFNFTSFKMMNEQLFWINLHWLNKSECHLSFECTCIILEENIRNDLSWQVDRLLMKSSTTHWEKTHNSICCAWLGKSDIFNNGKLLWMLQFSWSSNI